MSNYFKDLTIVIVSYAASNNVLRLLKKIPKEIKVIIVENSKDYKLEKKIKKKFFKCESSLST